MKNRLAGISLMVLSLLVMAEVVMPGTIHHLANEIQWIAKAKK